MPEPHILNGRHAGPSQVPENVIFEGRLALEALGWWWDWPSLKATPLMSASV